MTARPIHFEVEILYGTTFTTACGSRAAKHVTTDDAHVTCRACLAALGYDVAPVKIDLPALATTLENRRAA